MALQVIRLLMANIGKIATNQITRQLVKFIELVGGMRNFIGFITEPSDHFNNASEIFLFLFFGVGVIKSQIAVSIVFLVLLNNIKSSVRFYDKLTVTFTDMHRCASTLSANIF